MVLHSQVYYVKFRDIALTDTKTYQLTLITPKAMETVATTRIQRFFTSAPDSRRSIEHIT